jgi:hypothetical protein
MHFMGRSKIVQAAKLSRILFCQRVSSNEYGDHQKGTVRGANKGLVEGATAYLMGDHSRPPESYTSSTSATGLPTASTEAHFHPQ